jgi:hypothetical protein
MESLKKSASPINRKGKDGKPIVKSVESKRKSPDQKGAKKGKAPDSNASSKPTTSQGGSRVLESSPRKGALTQIGKKPGNPAVNISDVYLSKVPLYERMRIKHDKSNPHKEFEKERISEIKDKMRRVDLEEIRVHAQRVQSAARARDENQAKIMDTNMDPELIKTMKKMKEANNDLLHDKEEKQKRREHMLAFAKSCRNHEDKAVLKELASFKQDQNKFLVERSKLLEKKKREKEFAEKLYREQPKLPQIRTDRQSAKTKPNIDEPTAATSSPTVPMTSRRTLKPMKPVETSLPKISNVDELKLIQSKLKNKHLKSQAAIDYVI